MDWTEFKEESQCVLKPFSPVRIPHVEYCDSSRCFFCFNISECTLWRDETDFAFFFVMCIQSPKLVNSFFQNYPFNPQCVKIFLNDTLSTYGLQRNVFFLICTSLRSRNGNVNRNVKPFNAENLKFWPNMQLKCVRGVEIKHHTF
jgi:hypothetical protein